MPKTPTHMDDDNWLGSEIAGALEGRRRDASAAWQRLAADMERQPEPVSMGSARAVKPHAGGGIFSNNALRRWVGYSTIATLLGFASWQVLKPNLDNKASVPEAKVYTTNPGQRA